MSVKFSVIMPVYNREKTLERALNSLQQQRYHNFEVIIVDDGSTDNSVGKITPYLTDTRFRLLQLPQNSGVNRARNCGLTQISADSDWVTFLDSDDEFTLSALSEVAAVIAEHPAVKDFCFAVQYLDGSPASWLSGNQQLFSYPDLIKKDIKPAGEWVHVIAAALVRQKQFLYEEKVRNGFESLAYLRLAQQYQVLYSTRVVRLYHLDVEGLSRIATKTQAKSKDEIIGYSLFLQEFGDMVSRYNKADYALLMAVLGKTYLEVADLRQCLLCTFKAFLCRPIELRIYRNLLIMLKFIFSSPFSSRLSSPK